MLHSEYLSPAIRPQTRQHMLGLCEKRIKELDLTFDAFACRGVSGLLMALPLSERMNKGLIIVRKITDNNHGQLTEFSHPAETYLILDDFVASGETVRAIYNSIPETIKCVGILCYSDVDIGDQCRRMVTVGGNLLDHRQIESLAVYGALTNETVEEARHLLRQEQVNIG